MAKRKVINRFAELLAVKERRENRTYTRRELEEATGVSMTSIQNWIHNRSSLYSIEQMDKFANFLGCKPGDLFAWEDVQESPETKTPLAAAS